jgi:NADPH:quinone reductase
VKGLVVNRFGGPEVLEWREVPEPAPGPGELLVRSRAFAVQWADLMERKGRYPGGPQPPFIGGHDVVGEVVRVGDGVPSHVVGSRVLGVVPRGGAAAELVAVPTHWMHPVPGHVDDHTAAAVASAYFTADAAIVTLGRLQPGESVLVHAAAGSYGSAAVQLCRAYGAAQIIATAGSDEKLARAGDWGADVLVNYTTEDFVGAVREATSGRGVDLVLESVGGDVLGQSLDCLRPAGRLISIGASSGRSSERFRLQVLFEKGVVVGGFTLGLWVQDHPTLVQPSVDRVLDLLDHGAIAPVVGAVFAPGEVADAHRFVENRQSIGRTIVSLVSG